MEIFFTGIAAFTATNIDDLFLLTLFFGNKSYPHPKIVAGQVIGILTLIGLSLAGSTIGYLIKPEYVGLMGLFPIYLGIRQLIDLFRNKSDNDSDELSSPKHKSVILSVALVTIANGGDNIGIYIPLFVALSITETITTVIIFLLMTFLWCFIARYLTRHPLLKNTIDRCGHVVTPFVLILLGIFILYESNSLVLINVFR
jgi:cadmium resistance transport/sequestration family protein